MSPDPLSSENSWKACLKIIEKRINVQSFKTWFSSVSIKEIKDDRLTLVVPNMFFKDWLSDHYGKLIDEVTEEVFSKKMLVCYDLLEEGLVQTPYSLYTPGDMPSDGQTPPMFTSLYPKNTFENFVVGSSNQFAHAASMAVAEQPAKAYNPLFIYGGVGLGKTHLMHAIGNFIHVRNARAKLHYIPSEKFVNELINALRNDKMAEFRNRYRNSDVLMVDDIQFIAGKDRTQEEFFHTFNTLYESRKQIVISSDRFPKDIPSLEERLRSRFAWGLIADIQPPDLETKVAILNKKADEGKINLPQDVSLYISSRIKSNVRELEGCLIRISAFASLMGSEITLDLAKDVLGELFHDEDPPIDIKSIQKAVGEHFNLSVTELKSQKRSKSIALPRQIAMYLCRRLTKASLPEIGRQFGGKDHTTVIHSCSKIENQMKGDTDLLRTVNMLIKLIQRN